MKTRDILLRECLVGVFFVLWVCSGFHCIMRTLLAKRSAGFNNSWDFHVD